MAGGAGVLPTGTILGSYVIDGLVAQGGMGAVYRARNRVTGEPRALKVIRAHLAHDPAFVQRFMREAAIASKLRHPNLVETLEPGLDGDTVFLPMELLEGESLSARLKRVGALAPADAVRVLRPVCEAVQLLHDKRLLHRDLKPMNVFLARVEGVEVPKVLDFGTARDVEDDEHTSTGFVVGSPHYMAPEQAEGRKDLDARIDQYSLGVIAYQMLTGTRPYEGDERESALAKILRGAAYARPLELRSDIPPAVEQVVLRALSRDRDQRFTDVRGFGDALAAALAATSPTVVGAYPIPTPTVASGAMRVAVPEPATPPPATTFASAPPPAPSASGGRAVGVVIAALAIAVVVGGIGYALWKKSQRGPESVVAVSLGGTGVGPLPGTTPPAAVPPPVAAVDAGVVVAPPRPGLLDPFGGSLAAPPPLPLPGDAGARRDAGPRVDGGRPRVRTHRHEDAERCGPEYDRPCL